MTPAVPSLPGRAGLGTGHEEAVLSLSPCPGPVQFRGKDGVHHPTFPNFCRRKIKLRGVEGASVIQCRGGLISPNCSCPDSIQCKHRGASGEQLVTAPTDSVLVTELVTPLPACFGCEVTL